MNSRLDVRGQWRGMGLEQATLVHLIHTMTCSERDCFLPDQKGEKCPNDEIGGAAGMSESGGQRKSAVSKRVGRR